MACHISVGRNEYSNLIVTEFGQEACVSGHDFGPAVRTYWLVHYVVSGCGIYQVGERTHYVKTGEMFVIAPGVETYYRADETDPWNYIWVGFATESDITAYLSEVISCPEAEKIFHAMKRCEDYEPGRNLYLTGRVWELFALLLEQKGGSRDDYVQQALDCIHAEYMYGITVEAVAHRLNLERTYFSTLFKKQLGISPKQYLLNYRMNAAASLLRQSGIGVSVVANSVGYSDLYVFSKMFKRHFGVAPTQYRTENGAPPG